jgi:uncharacterized repeat protein (TIGR03803 family)
MRRIYSRVASFVLILVGLVLTTGISAWASDTFTVLYDFNPPTGYFPVGDLIFDSAGNLYGTTAWGGLISQNCEFDCGVVFELSPSGGGWTYTVLYYFTGGSDGGEPGGRLTLDAKGNLYGTASIGGTVGGPCSSTGCGTVFELSPSGGNWTFAVLHSFTGSDGTDPVTGLTPDGAGNLYGTTSSGGSGGDGIVFELVPSGGTWTFSTLYNFTSYSDGVSPFSDLAIDSVGNLYGATLRGGSSKPSCLGGNGCGTVFELSPSGGSWQFSLLHTFQGIKEGAKAGDGIYPWGALAMDSAGNVYGTTYEGGKTCNSCNGTVFKLSQSAGKWKEQILHRFGGKTADGEGPLGGVTIDKAGNLYGTTHDGGANCGDCGTVFQLTPNRKGTGWKFTSLYSFYGADGGEPRAGVVPDASGNLYGTTTSGGADGSGTLFELSPP